MIDTMMHMADTLYCMEIPYEERYADGLRLIAVYVQNGEVHYKNLSLRKRLPDTNLSLHWDTFRDFTQPGATEQWTLRVCDSKGHPVSANVMLAMYDASLDAFGANKWMLSLARNHSIPYSQIRYGSGYAPHANYWQNFDVWVNNIRNYDYSRLNMDYFRQRGNFRVAGAGPILYSKSAALKKVRVESGISARNTAMDAVVEESAELEDAAVEEEFNCRKRRHHQQ